MDIYDIIDKNLQKFEPLNIVIAGATCSGKTTLSNNIVNHYKDKFKAEVICQDDYFKDLVDIPRSRGGYLTDSIEAFHVDEFKEDVGKLLTSKMILVPKYDIAINKRVSKNVRVRLGRINIFEGLHTISILKGIENSIYIYISESEDICLKRRIKRDTLKYGVPEHRIIEYFEECILPMIHKYVNCQYKEADIIIEKGGIYDKSKAIL